MIYNISKRNNIKDLCWTAAANQFEVLFVSGSSFDGVPHILLLITLSHVDLHLELPISLGLTIIPFRKINECKEFLNDLGVPLIGIEILEVMLSILPST